MDVYSGEKEEAVKRFSGWNVNKLGQTLSFRRI